MALRNLLMFPGKNRDTDREWMMDMWRGIGGSSAGRLRLMYVHCQD